MRLARKRGRRGWRPTVDKAPSTTGTEIYRRLRVKISGEKEKRENILSPLSNFFPFLSVLTLKIYIKSKDIIYVFGMDPVRSIKEAMDV